MKITSNLYLSLGISIVFFILQPLAQPQSQPLPRLSQQLIVVITPDWESSCGHLYVLRRQSAVWQIATECWPVSLGRNGLGWGRGLYAFPEPGPVKKEGDLKAPAGLFAIRHHLYGYDDRVPCGVDFSYTQLTPDWVGVDDPDSRYYNQVLDKTTVKDQDWKSHEQMRRNDDLYRWVLFVEHNTTPPVPYAGSCIFMHLWRKQGEGTAGCTAMSEENFLKLLRQISPGLNPQLLQIPGPVYEKYRILLNLPALF